MKQFFTILLAGLLAVPTSGCAITPAASAKAKQAAIQAEDSDRLVTQYEQAIQTTGQLIAALSEAITPLPVQESPASKEQKEQCGSYRDQLNEIDQAIADYSKDLEVHYDSHTLTTNGYDALSFQLSQLKARSEKLRDTLCVVYGTTAAPEDLPDQPK